MFEAATISFSEIESFKEIARECSPMEVRKLSLNKIFNLQELPTFNLSTVSAVQDAKYYLQIV